MKLVDLPETFNEREAYLFKNVSQAIKFLREKKAITSAGDNGAINIWDDFYGNYRCEAMRHCNILEIKIYTNLKDTAAWIKDWLLKII